MRSVYSYITRIIQVHVIIKAPNLYQHNKINNNDNDNNNKKN